MNCKSCNVSCEPDDLHCDNCNSTVCMECEFKLRKQRVWNSTSDYFNRCFICNHDKSNPDTPVEDVIDKPVIQQPLNYIKKQDDHVITDIGKPSKPLYTGAPLDNNKNDNDYVVTDKLPNTHPFVAKDDWDVYKRNQDIVEANWRSSLREHPIEYDDDNDYIYVKKDVLPQKYKHPFNIKCKKCHRSIDENTKNNMILKNGYSIASNGYITKNKSTESKNRITNKKPLCVACWNKKIQKFQYEKPEPLKPGKLDGDKHLIKHIKTKGKYYRPAKSDDEFDSPDELEIIEESTKNININNNTDSIQQYENIKRNYPELMKFENRYNGDFVCYEPDCDLNGHNFQTGDKLKQHTDSVHLKSINYSTTVCQTTLDDYVIHTDHETENYVNFC